MSEINTELKNIVEAALLVAAQPLTLDKLLSMFPEGSRPERDELKAVIDDLAADYAERGIEIKQIDRGYRVQSREKYADWLSRLSDERPPRYSRALLETLAIIAYRQPVTRGDIEEIRGVSVSSEIIRTLLEREWIRQVGHRDVPGKPVLYGTARGFLEYFNLKSLDELPTLAELRDLDDISRELNLPLALEGDEGQADAGENADGVAPGVADAEFEAVAVELDAAADDGAAEDMPLDDDGAGEFSDLEDEAAYPTAARGNE